MRDIPPILLDKILSKEWQPAILVEFGFDSGPIGMWTGLGDLEFNDITFVAGGNLLSFSPIRETEDMQATGVKITQTGLSTSLIALSLTEPYQGRPLKIYLSIITEQSRITLEDDELLLWEDSGFVLLEQQLISQPFVIFEGLMDVVDFDADRDTATINLSAENILSLMKKKKERRYTHEDQTREFPGDMGFEFIAQLQDKEIVW